MSEPKTTAELRAELQEAETRERQADQENRAAQSKAWKAITASPESWEWDAHKSIAGGSSFSSDPPAGVEVLRIVCRIKPELVQAWRKNGPSTFSSDLQDGRWIGTNYYRKADNHLSPGQGILTHFGGGHMILQDPCIVTDAEWQAMCNGVMPSHVLKPWS